MSHKPRSSSVDQSRIPMLSKKRQSSTSRENDEGNNRHSNASQPKQSLASSNRPTSSIGASSSRAKGRTENIKDPRSISDKNFQENARREILDLLMNYGFPHEISPKILSNPTNSDFKKIVEFLCSLMCLPDNYMLEQKLDESLPDLLKILDYPVAIQKRSFQTVGVPHTWPSLVALLDWMKHVISFDSSDLYGNILESFSPVKRAFFDFCVKAYNLFLNGLDDYSEEIEEFQKNLVKNMDINAVNHSLKEEIKKLGEEIAEMRSKNSKGKSLLAIDEAKGKEYEGRKANVSNILQDLKNKVSQATVSIEESEKQIEKSDAEIAEVLAAVEKCEAEVIKQSQLGFDVLSLTSECKKIKKDVTDMEKQIESARNDEEVLAEDIAKCDEEMKIMITELSRSLVDSPYLSGDEQSKLFNVNVRPEQSEEERMQHSLDLLKKLINETVKTNLNNEKDRVNNELKSSDLAKDKLMQELRDREEKRTQAFEEKKSLETRIKTKSENHKSQLEKLSKQIEFHAASHAQSKRELEKVTETEKALEKEVMDMKDEQKAKREQWVERIKEVMFITKKSKEKALKMIQDCDNQMAKDKKKLEEEFQELLKREQQ